MKATTNERVYEKYHEHELGYNNENILQGKNHQNL